MPFGRVRILDAADGKEVRQVEVPANKKLPLGQANAVRHVALSPDGKTLAGVGSDSQVYLWDVATGKERARVSAFGPPSWPSRPTARRWRWRRGGT